MAATGGICVSILLVTVMTCCTADGVPKLVRKAAPDEKCEDAAPNCHEYSLDDLCTNPVYTDWRLKYCKLTCNLCSQSSPPPITPAPDTNCYDKIANCHEYQHDTCTNPYFAAWAREHCSQFCGFCQGTTTTPQPTTTDTPHPEGLQCFDRLDCENYYIKTSCCGDYEPWARQNCAKYCKFCTPTVTEAPLCHDTDDKCGQYGDDLCTNPQYDRFVKEHCAGFCKICEQPEYIPECAGSSPGGTTSAPAVTTASTSQCQDIIDCSGYDIKVACCGAYESWARHNCPKTCKFCYPSVPEIPLCTDTDPLCSQYGDDLCTNPQYERFIYENCAGFCKVCDRPIYVPDCANTTLTTPSPGTTGCTEGSLTHPEGSSWESSDCTQHCTCEDGQTNKIVCNTLSCPEAPDHCSVVHLPGHCCPIIHDCRPQ